ncbi:MAG: LysM peptidoglycan-binding domain-containing protein [Lachnospiraceae bacterium]
MKKYLLICMMIVSFYSGLFGNHLLNAHAEEKEMPERNRYYTSIQIRQGETLWEIANRFSGESGLTVQAYMDELIQMNGLRNDTIHAGEFLTVVYYSD